MDMLNITNLICSYGAAMTLITELLIERDGPEKFPKHIQEFWKNRTREVILGYKGT